MAKTMEKNQFLDAVYNNGKGYTENGALTNLSCGSVLADEFGKAANYRGRTLDEVFLDQEKLWEEDSEKALRFPFYLRMITRKTKVNEKNITDTVQKGQGARDESFKRLLWIAVNHPDSFYKNIWILPLVGSWKDVWTLLVYDETFGVHVLKEDVMFELIKQGMLCKAHVDLIKKFMPRIKTNSKCTTDRAKLLNKFAKDFANYNKMSYEEYNHLKTSGTAHDFQKKICAKKFDELEWSHIPGKALNLIVNGNFLKNHDLEKNYTEWVVKQPTAKFTGYVHELGHQVIKSVWARRDNIPLYKKVTWNKQFDELIRKAQEDDKITGNVWCALDTSGSMTSPVVGDISAYDICISLGVFFSTLNKGAFNKNVIMFDYESHVKQLKGDFTDMINDIVYSNVAWGSTNFQSVVGEIVRIRKENPSIPLEDYPKTLLVVSDMQFNPADGKGVVSEETNYELAKAKLATVFPQEWVDAFKFIWWDCASRKGDFPATLDDGGCYFISGFDGSIISMLCGEEVEAKEAIEKKPISMEEVINNALNQEILNYIKL